ncbi:MAG: polysaccharide biosynthesis tyrosine autokinase [Actinomycetota bacterium]|nr:polysaccharide biosynthesis tyrosine autokinase [Actinomycetota bacterium]
MPVQDPSQAAAKDFELRDYLRVLKRRKVPIILVTFFVVVIALAASYVQTPIYSATAQVLLQARNTAFLFDPSGGIRADPARAVLDEILVIQSEPVRTMVRTQIGSAPPVSAGPVGQTNAINVSAESTDPSAAAKVANAYVNAYIEYRRKQVIDDTLAASQQIQTKIGDLQKQIDTAAPAQKESLVSAQALFKQKLDELQVGSAIQAGGAQLVTSASAPATPVRPTPKKNGIIALIGGLLLGVGVAFLLDYLDDSVKNKEDLASATSGLPVIGLIPVVSDWREQTEAQVVSLSAPKSPPAEAYRTLRTALQFLALEHPMKTLQITSAGPQEGKSTTLANLAVALARAGQRVVVVCCDLRRPRIHEFFELDNSAGFTSVLLGKVSLTGALQAVPGQPRISLLASGPLPPNPSELLSSRRTVEVLALLQAEFDIVLIDSPPVLPVTDALVISGLVDATLVVSVAGGTTRKEAARTVELLRQVEAPLVGSVLNGARSDGSYGYGYDSHYYQYEQPEKSPLGKRRPFARSDAGAEPLPVEK